MDRRGIGVILVCPSRAERKHYQDAAETNRLYDRLLAGDPPSWLTAVPADPARHDGFRLYRVVRP